MIAPAAPHPNDIAEKLTGRPYTSWSATMTYMACPLRFELRDCQKLPAPTVAAALAFGGAFHAGAEHHYRESLEGRPAPGMEALLAACNNAWTEHDSKAIQYGTQHTWSRRSSVRPDCEPTRGNTTRGTRGND